MIRLTLLPCGCFVDGDSLAIKSCCGRYAVCHWCSAGFNWAELRKWLAVDRDERTIWGRAPLPLIRFGKTVLEVTEFCNCGAPIVRECAEKVVFHLAVPPSAVETLFN